jgi:hypothetical protein
MVRRGKTMYMSRLCLYIAFFLLLQVRPVLSQHMQGMEQGEMMVHPFLAHMGLPDRSDEFSLRVTPLRTRIDGIAETDLAVHLESGLGHRIGLHIRTDGIRREQFSEVAVQYGLLMDKAMSNGISAYAELHVPTGDIDQNRYQGLLGVSWECTRPDMLRYDGDIEYNFNEKLFEYEYAIVFRMSRVIFPTLEIRGDVDKDTVSVYILPGIKFRIDPRTAVGLGFQAALAEDREFDTQALLTFEFANY